MPPSKRKEQQSEDQDYSDDQQLDEEEKIVIKKPKVQRLDNMKNFKKIVINVSMTQYPVIIEVAQELGWKVQYSADAGDWDVFWTDWHIQPNVLIQMHLFQKISHLPGIHILARKNMLGLNLMAMRANFPQQYQFFPLTWMLPQQYVEFRTYFQSKPKGKARTFIVKPQADCQGRGIFLTRKLQSIQNGKHYVVQRYVSRPYLIDNLKFDLRIYVLIGSINPLRIYLYEDGLARFATQAYIEPNSHNLQKQYMHLTNYAINKKNPKFIFNNNASNMGIGHKRSLLCVLKQLEGRGVNVQQLKNKIKDLIIKTIITGFPIMSHQYKCSQPQDYTGNMCFHILGFDIMMKNNGDPILLQVNHTPSFTTDTPLDFKIKKALIKDTLRIMNVNLKKKNQLYNLCMQNNQARLLTGKRNILQGKQREQLVQKYQKQRQQYQKNNLGGFQVIYPSQNQQRMSVYKTLIQYSNKQYFEQKGSIRMKMAQKQSKRLAREQYKQLKKNKKQKQKQENTAQNKGDKQKQKQRQKENQDKFLNIQVIKQEHQEEGKQKQSTQQTAENNQNQKKVYKKASTPVSLSENHLSLIQQKQKTIDHSQLSARVQVAQKIQKSKNYPSNLVANWKNNIHKKIRNQKTPILKQHQQINHHSKLPTTEPNNSIKTTNTQETKRLFQKKVHIPARAFSQRLAELPSIIDNTTQMLQKSNIIKASQYDRRRYIKGPKTQKQHQVQRSISGKNYIMTKSTSLVQQEKQDINSRPNLSGLMARKKQEKIQFKRKISNQGSYGQTKQKGNKIFYNGFHANYNPSSGGEYSTTGQYVMPKIFCLNFEAQKSPNQTLKFLMFRNLEEQGK